MDKKAAKFHSKKVGEKDVKKKHELAKIDYFNGLTLKNIAEKYDTPLNTVKSWKRRHKWSDLTAPKEGAIPPAVEVVAPTKKLREIIRKSLLDQLSSNSRTEPHYVDLVDDYMSLWDIKNKLIEDIEERGVTVTWTNGKQSGKKKNDSVSELNKTNMQMLKLLSELGLKATEIDKDDDDDEDL